MEVLLKVLIRLLEARLKVLLKVLIRLLKVRLKVLLKVLIRLLKARLTPWSHFKPRSPTEPFQGAPQTPLKLLLGQYWGAPSIAPGTKEGERRWIFVMFFWIYVKLVSGPF